MTIRPDLEIALELLVLKASVRQKVGPVSPVADLLDEAAQRLIQVAVLADPSLAAAIAAHANAQGGNVVPFPQRGGA